MHSVFDLLLGQPVFAYEIGSEKDTVSTMSDSTNAILRSWEIRWLILAFLLALGLFYTLGWTRLREKGAAVAKVWRLLAYWFGLTLVFLALMSPLETLSGVSFTMHMLQHLLLIMFAPAPLMAAEPLPMIMWGLPAGLRQRVGGALFGRTSPVRNALRMAAKPAVVWAAFFISLWGWHDANLYNATLENNWIHDFEHITFFYSALLLWWHITAAAPRIHKRFKHPARIALTLACLPANMIAGVVIAMSPKIIYTGYIPFENVNPFGMDVLSDQRLGGVIMWVPGSMMYVIAVVALVALWLSSQERAAKQ